MPVRRCIRKKRKLIEKDEQYAVFKRAAHAVPDDAPSSDPEGLPEDNAVQICRDLGLSREKTLEPGISADAATPERPPPARADTVYSPPHAGVDAPITIDFDVDEEMVEQLMAAHVPPSTYSPLVANGSSPVRMTQNQLIFIHPLQLQVIYATVPVGMPNQKIGIQTTQSDLREKRASPKSDS